MNNLAVVKDINRRAPLDTVRAASIGGTPMRDGRLPGLAARTGRAGRAERGELISRSAHSAPALSQRPERSEGAGEELSALNFIRQGAGTPVILIHGLAASLHDWDFLAPELAAAGYQACALDLLGHGESAKPSRLEAYTAQGVYDHLAG